MVVVDHRDPDEDDLDEDDLDDLNEPRCLRSDEPSDFDGSCGTSFENRKQRKEEVVVEEKEGEDEGEEEEEEEEEEQNGSAGIDVERRPRQESVNLLSRS